MTWRLTGDTCCSGKIMTLGSPYSVFLSILNVYECLWMDSHPGCTLSCAMCFPGTLLSGIGCNKWILHCSNSVYVPRVWVQHGKLNHGLQSSRYMKTPCALGLRPLEWAAERLSHLCSGLFGDAWPDVPLGPCKVHLNKGWLFKHMST